MKKNINLLSLLPVFIALVLSFTSCNLKINDLNSKFSSGVVLVQNASYYELETSIGSIYFASYDPIEDEVSGLQFDQDSIQYQLNYGTGFFISEDGKIATNKHVVAAEVTEKDAQKLFGRIISALKAAASDEFDELVSYQQDVRNQMRYAYNNNDYTTYQRYDEIDDLIIARKNELRENYQIISSVNYRDAELHYYNEVSIAYNDTYVTDFDDFEDCVIKSTSDEADLAIIQLKNKTTPSSKFIFNVPSDNPLEKYTVFEKLSKMFGGDKNEKLAMISFNLGPTLAITDEGIKSQINDGSISQSSSDRIMYSIPALHGSSGSPVLNRRGQLVAINFLGLNGAQNFNYGIRVEALYRLLH